MNVYAQTDLQDTSNVVTGILQATAAPTDLPAGRQFVDITTLPDKDILGWTWNGGLDFSPPVEPSAYSTDLSRIAAKVGAITNG